LIAIGSVFSVNGAAEFESKTRSAALPWDGYISAIDSGQR
jgi:hypothetical protein